MGIFEGTEAAESEPVAAMGQGGGFEPARLSLFNRDSAGNMRDAHELEGFPTTFLN